MEKNDSGLLASAFALENFFKKYKVLIIVVLVAIVAALGYYFISSWLNERRIEQSATLYDEVVKNPSEATLEKLKQSNFNLYALYTISRNHSKLSALEPLLESSKANSSSKLDAFLRDYISYQIASLKANPNSLENINSNFADYAALQRAYLLALNGDVSASRQILSTIPTHSPVKEVANLLSHYGVNKESK